MVIEWVILDKLPFLTNDEGIKVKSVFESLYLYLQNKQFWQYDIRDQRHITFGRFLDVETS